MTHHIVGIDILKARLELHQMPTGENHQFANNAVGSRRQIA